MAAIFKTVSWQVDQLVNGVKTGTIQLPDLQRPFVWPGTKVRDLFDSMYRGYPVGELMFWDVAAEGETRSIAGRAELAASHQIIDGQQRLTSLFAAMQGHAVRDEAYRERKITISFNPFSEKFEVRTPLIAKSVQWVEDISQCFDSPIRARKDFIKRLEASDNELVEDAEERIEEVFAKLSELKNYQFDVVHIQKEADKALVADVFVRINSEGVRLKAYDYILTWLSVFWPEGREAIEEFARNSRISPQRASEISRKRVNWTAYNPYIAVETGHLVRAMVAVGQRRGRLQDAYAALQAKDPTTGFVNSERQESELGKLKAALPIVTDKVSWTEYIHAIQTAGFRSAQNVTSNMNIIYSYVIFLLGRTRYAVPLAELRTLIARWLFMSQLTARYTGSSESQIQKDLDRLEAVERGDAEGFVRVLNEIIGGQLTPDFWRYSLPQHFITSGPGLSPHYQCYLASLNVLDAPMFMLDSRVRDWMDPSQPAVKGTELHHLFPRDYQEKVLGITDIKRINQVGNFAPTDWSTNITISNKAPAEYWPNLVAARAKNDEWLANQMYFHALPQGWEHMEYDEFLSARRSLMAEVTRDAFIQLSGGIAQPVEPSAEARETVQEPTLVELVEKELLRPGDLLDPVDPEWVVDAVINDDGALVIDGTKVFDSLDEAAHHLDVTNMTGFAFWALERGDDLIPLAELVMAERV
ncbi:GmrSD restriction endonuclease domain-containing protein [Propionibacteriaceae bacterium G57]|uniref:GmrSD restriction endonuclease domain-containing protein n=1 Tax=Aestuariimicrobium sp. G57 TaxID=3418485 RepID=UPI003DA71432